MADRDGATEGGGHTNIVLTPEEKKVFGQLFQAADSEGIGVVTGEHAVKFFEKSGLSPRILGEIWGIADTLNRGLLTKVGFSVALRLIGQAQNGHHPRPELAQQPGPLPRFEGVNIQYPPAPGASPPMPSLQAQATGAGAVLRLPQLMPQDVEKFTSIFEQSGAVDGVLQGTDARDIFQRSKLPTQLLIQIWNLADRQHRGALSASEFVVAMHLITCCKSHLAGAGTMPILPQMLPPALYDAAAGRPSTRGGPDRRGTGRGMPPVPPIPKQFSGPQAGRAQSPLSRQFTPPIQQQPIQRDNTGWAIKAEDKARFDQVFLTVDKANHGFITGEEAVPFFSNSKLSEEVLAQIWDLADINKSGQLNRDEFAIAMYLIVQQRSNPGVPLPDVLPPNLIPPSMRQQQMAPPAVQPSPFDPVPQAPPPPKSAADDLFGLVGAFSSSQSQAGPAPTQAAGPFDGGDPFGISKDPAPSMSPNTASPALFGRPTAQFVPTSSFGQSILPSITGGSNTSREAPQPAKNDMDDLLGDADPEISKKLTNESTELANLSNQISGLTKQTTELKSKRASTEHELSTLSVQKQNIEAQLNQLRAAYEKEAAHVRRVEDQLAASRQETVRASQEYQRIEAEYQQLQYKKQEVSSSLEADRRENENLKERMNVINAENRKLRAELEQLENQARREKGLVSINKKQVAQSESEREKLKNSIDEARSTVTSPVPGSPTLSQSSATGYKNPFHRKTSPPLGEAFSPSPFAPPTSGSMDDVFGPAFASKPTTPAFAQKAPTEVSASAPSAPSVSEGGLGDVSTPPTSPPASSYANSPHPSEPPAPAIGNQIQSNFLPLGNLTRADSTTSSVQVNPSASVRDDVSRPDTPTNWMSSNVSQAPSQAPTDRDAPPSRAGEERRNSVSVRSDAGTEASNKPSFFEKRVESPFAERHNTGGTSGGDENKAKLEREGSFASFSNVPGAFPSIDGSAPKPIAPMATGESTRSNRSRTSNMSKSAFGSDPFSGLGKEEPRSGSAQAAFEDAFSQFTSNKGKQRVSENHTGGSGSVKPSFHEEFPPIEELQADSDSDSEAGGFEDDFKPGQQATVSTLAVGQPRPDTTTSNDRPPSEAAQQPPPSYVSTNTTADKSNFPAEYSNLLPSRSDPMKHDAPTPGGSTNAVTFPSTTPIKDDFDDQFGDLADAKEADEKSTDNEFGIPSSGFGDFDPVFDAPSRPAPGTAVSQDNDEFSKFTFNIDDSAPAPKGTDSLTGSPQMATVKTASPQDWDAIFADFGSANSADKAKEASANLNRKLQGEHEGGGVSLGEESAEKEGGVKVEEEKVAKLREMGFERESAIRALEKVGGNIDRLFGRRDDILAITPLLLLLLLLREINIPHVLFLSSIFHCTFS
ncbi:hypothetical protein EX30DRAFT_388717 [Ascodesmis nigricans]|uniref:EF-hand n=1 Tax=Ascodesmis nigricans TaxID=341454 RepID=A0A4S2MR14_9PEZI|nr:hypothetical protein EX30DRAFT_388717 [Ascodesmis nigricans]